MVVRVFGVALLSLSLGLTLCQPEAWARPEEGQGGETAVLMRNLIMYPYADVAAEVTELHGAAQPVKAGGPIDLDDVSSYRIAVASASMRLDAHDLTVLMNRHILPSGRSPIKHVDVTLSDGELHMSGTMEKLGVPLPFTATATLAPTQAGEMRVHITQMHAGDVVPKGVMDFLGMDLSSIAQPENKGAFHLEGDDMVVPMAAMFPPPIFEGAFTSFRVTHEGVYAVVGRAEPAGAAEKAQPHSVMAMRGGTVAFKRLTMRDADIAMVPLDPARNLGYSPRGYYAQMLGGRVIPQADGGLLAQVADARDVARRR